MNWSDWVYLGTGLGLGIGFRSLFARAQRKSSQVTPVDNLDESALVQQIKQTELAYQMVQELSQFKAGFLARTTHVLRSPLNGLIGLHQLILSNLCENPEEEREFIAQAHERALKLLKLIDEILRVARIEYGTNKLDIQPRCLGELLQEVHDLTYMLAENRNFRFKLLPPDPEIYVLADPYWLRQVLINLVDTTIAQMEEGSICISTGTPTDNFVPIWLDVPTHATPVSEPIDLMTDEVTATHEDKVVLSPAMKLLLNQNLLQAMGGKLEIVASPTSTESEPMTRLQIIIEHVIPETEFLQMEGNLI